MARIRWTSTIGENIVAGPDGCEYFVKLSGSTFHLVPNADPLCGTIIPGKTVTP